MKTVLITGCSDGGIGAAAARAFQENGYHVFATARTTSKMSSLSKLSNVTTLGLDVTNEPSISNAVKAVADKTGGKLDVLCNNAGAPLMMPALDTTLEKAKRMFDVNLWGVVAVTNAFAPLVIEAKGTIATTGSIAGEINIPFYSLYAASKSAVHTYCETLRLELAPFGVKVLTVATGVIDTQFVANLGDSELPANSRYKAVEENYQRALRGEGYTATNADVYAEQFVRAVKRGQTGKVWIGKQASLVRYGKQVLPTTVIDFFISQPWSLDRV